VIPSRAQSDSDVKDIGILAKRIKLLLAGQRLAVQGGALADLTGMWLASLPQQMRFLEGHITSIKMFAEAYGREAYGRSGINPASTSS
jgi:hypothetical protein